MIPDFGGMYNFINWKDLYIVCVKLIGIFYYNKPISMIHSDDVVMLDLLN